MAEFLNISAAPLPKAPKVVEVKPFGSAILVELLSKQELTSSIVKLHGSSNDQGGGNANQGYVVALGAGLPADVNLKVGQRVLINGGFIPVPPTDGIPEGRARGLVEYVSIKAVLTEDADMIGDFPA